MKKHRTIKICFGLLLAFVISFGVLIEVEAEPNILDSCKTDSKRTKCNEKDAAKYYNLKHTFDENTKILTLSADNGVFDAVVSGEIIGTLEQKEYVLTAGKKLEIDFSKATEASVTVTLTLKEDSGEPYCSVGCFKEEYNIEIEGPPTFSDTIYNSNYNGVCKTFRENDYKNAGAEEKAYYEQNLSYCFQEYVTFNYKADSVTTMINNVKLGWKLKNTTLMDEDIITPTIGKKPIQIEGGTDKERVVGKLQCDPYTDGNEDKFYTKQTEAINDVCSVECVEELTVTYGPPSSVKAGLCFEYTVTVRSKVSCKSKINSNPPTKKKACNPYPVCNSIVNYTDQGGPNDEFDSCIQECDNGKYSQKCINKCYKKVYGTTTNDATKTMLSYEDVNVTNMANNISCNGARGNKNANYKDIYNEISANWGGHYYWDGNTIKWKNDSGCYWDGLGAYYFNSLNKAGRTVTNIQGGSWGGFRGGYKIDSNGFKRSYSCNENCVWVGCSQGDALGEQQAEEQYQKDLAEYNRKIEECSSYNKCEENTATFTMTVNNETSTKKGAAATITFGPSTNTPNGPNETSGLLDYAGIIQEDGGLCYGKVNTEGDDYKTVINFPGSWINNKTLEVVYIEPDKTQLKYYHAKPHYFCTSPDSKNVNVKWWLWKESKRSAPAEGSSEYNDIKNDITENITASIKNFGRYRWSINIGCFYAIYNSSPTVDPSDPDGNLVETNDEEDSTEITNYKFRSVNLNDLFPSEDTITTNENVASSDDVGYNWSANATNVNNPDYEVTPTALIASIQKAGNSIYTDNKQLDYEFNLSSADLRAIKKDYANVPYSTFGSAKKDSTDKDGGITSYKSALVEKYATKQGIIGCNNQYGSNCQTFTDDIVNSKKAIVSARDK